MKHKFFSLFNRLSVRVFFTIWLSMAILIALTILIPHLDKRRILSLSTAEAERYKTHILDRFLEREHFNHRTNRQAPGITQMRGGRFSHGNSRILITIPEDLEERYRVIHGIKNDQMISFIINTISSSNAHQQEINQEVILGPFHHVDRPTEHFYIVGPAPPQSYYFTRLFDSPILLALLITIICTPIALHLARSLSKPVEKLQEAAERVAKGDWSVDPSLVQGPIEYQTLGESFNRMVSALTEAEEEKNRLFANLSHELRTPLTRIKLTNSLLRRKSDQDLSDEITRIEENLNQIEDRIQAMLALSRQVILNRQLLEKFELADLLIPLLEEASFEANENGKILHYGEIPNITIAVNAELFGSGLENILRNAIYYATREINVTIALSRPNHLSITIADDGPGVNPNEIERLFEAFFRGERPTQMNDYGGSGLGLAIAKQMVDSHYGTIDALNDNGLSITIRIPLSKDDIG